MVNVPLQKHLDILHVYSNLEGNKSVKQTLNTKLGKVSLHVVTAASPFADLLLLFRVSLFRLFIERRFIVVYRSKSNVKCQIYDRFNHDLFCSDSNRAKISRWSYFIS